MSAIQHRVISVALSSGGNTAMVGGWKDGVSGAAWYMRALMGVEPARRQSDWYGCCRDAVQGCSVALSADGNTAIIAVLAMTPRLELVWSGTMCMCRPASAVEMQPSWLALAGFDANGWEYDCSAQLAGMVRSVIGASARCRPKRRSPASLDIRWRVFRRSRRLWCKVCLLRR